MSPPHLYDRVELLVDDYSGEGASAGSAGYVIEVHDDGALEIEFSNPDDGTSYAQIVVRPNEVQVSPLPGESS